MGLCTLVETVIGRVVAPRLGLVRSVNPVAKAIPGGKLARRAGEGGEGCFPQEPICSRRSLLWPPPAAGKWRRTPAVQEKVLRPDLPASAIGDIGQEEDLGI